MPRLAPFAFAALFFAFASFARADGSESVRAADLKRQADAAFDAKHYDEALKLYDESYALVPQVSLFYNRGRAHQYLAHYPRAEAELERFEREATPDLKAKVPGFDSVLADVRKHVATVRVVCSVAGARVLAEGLDVTTPLAEPLRVNAGPQRIEVIADGYYPAHREVDLRGGETTSIDFPLSSRDRHGLLSVRSSIAGTTISVDDKILGVTPTETPLDQGPHRVRAAHESYSDALTQVVITAGERKELRLDPLARPSVLTRWWFWTIVSAAVLGGAAAITTYALTTERALPSGTFSPGGVHF